MTFQKRLQRVMRRKGLRVADLARRLDQPYTTVREWVLFGRVPGEVAVLERRLTTLEQSNG